ncbi:hypothetical protein AYI68_g6822 [Smittium mucronatum]|uniref:Uncharacterized protein n=1 Tax=Smittium mucronatum TaxID=133383 RepID=A0A1R0GQE8_9FUNG|nr:hypothetical protein AYI68_g6822 [Smittium mucronatum]
MERFASSPDNLFVRMEIASFLRFLLLLCGYGFSVGPSQNFRHVQPDDEFGSFLLMDVDFVRSEFLDPSVTIIQNHCLSVNLNQADLNIASRPQARGPD